MQLLERFDRNKTFVLYIKAPDVKDVRFSIYISNKINFRFFRSKSKKNKFLHV